MSNDTTPQPEYKTCTKCGQRKPATHEFFYNDKKTKDGLAYHCKECVKAHVKAWRERDPEHARRKESEWREANRDKLREHYVESRKRLGKELREPKDKDDKRRCATCHEYLPANTEFFYEKRDGSGLTGTCIECNKQKGREYYYANGGKPQVQRRKDGKKQCSCCEQWFPATAEHFNRARNRKDGLYPECKQCTKPKHKKIWVELIQDPDFRQKRRASNRKYYIEHPEVAVVSAARRRARKRELPNTLTSEEWRAALGYWGGRCAICGKPNGLWHSIAQDHWIPISCDLENNPGTVAENVIPMCHASRDGDGGCNNSKSNRMPNEWLQDTFGTRKAKVIMDRVERYFTWVREQRKFAQQG